MNRLLRAQLKKVYGKDFDKQFDDDKFKYFSELVEQGYEDLYNERELLERTLEVNAAELTASNRKVVESSKLTKSVIDSVSDVIFYKGLDFKYIWCNKKFESFVGKKEKEIIGKSDYDFLPNNIADKFREVDKAILVDPKEREDKVWLKDHNGADMYRKTTKSPLFDKEGKIIGIVGVSRDITKEYKLEKELKSQHTLLLQQSRLASMGEMIGNIAHQWRQPLNALGLVVQKIGFYHKRGILDDEKILLSVDKSMSLIDSMSETIDDFRDFFSPNKEKDNFTVCSAIEKAYEIVSPVFEINKINYTLIKEDIFYVNGFKNEFSQVILNTLNNAKDALLENGVKNPYISIKITKENDNVVVDIEDNAGGIDKKIIEKIFDPYFTTKPQGEGTGLGLYMSKIIIEEHMNGKLSASSRNGKTNIKIVLSR